MPSTLRELITPVTYLLRIYHPFPLYPQIPLQPQQHDGNVLPLPQPQPRHLLTPHVPRIRQTPSITDIVAHNHKIRSQQCVILRRSGVVYLKAVWAVVHANVVDEWLIVVAELREWGGWRDGLGERGGAEGEFGEEGAFAAGGVADEENCDGGAVGVHADVGDVVLGCSSFPWREIDFDRAEQRAWHSPQPTKPTYAHGSNHDNE